MAIYDTTALDNSTDVYQIFFNINAISNGLLANMLLAMISLVLIMVFRNRGDFKDVLLGVSFMVSFIAVLMFLAELVTISVFYFPFILLIGAVIYKIWGG